MADEVNQPNQYRDGLTYVRVRRWQKRKLPNHQEYREKRCNYKAQILGSTVDENLHLKFVRDDGFSVTKIPTRIM